MSTWRMRHWSYDPTVALVIFEDVSRVPNEEVLTATIDEARRRGARLLRTSALASTSRPTLVACGFQIIDELVLLELNLRRPLPDPSQRVGALRPNDYERAAEIDLASFGPRWASDDRTLRDIRTATPYWHAGAVWQRHGWRRRLTGYAVSGAADTTGYLQRLAVDPEHRRQGLARDLVIDAAGWMQRIGANRALVNTGTDNDGALRLYEQLGFARLSSGLIVAEFDLRRR